jgi:photosystem II stability/assembly factor-like uncharacterized protein
MFITVTPLIYAAGAWTSLGPGGGPITAIAVDPKNPNNVYVGATHGVFKSTNGGDSWINVLNPGRAVFDAAIVVIDPQTPSIVYIDSNDGRYKSTDGGANWTKLTQDNPSVRLYALAFNPSNPSILYGGSSGEGIFKSVDGGIQWKTINEGLLLLQPNGNPKYSPVSIFAIDPRNADVIYVVTGQGFYKSVNGGNYWNLLNLTWIGALAVDPINPAIIYATGYKSNSTSSGMFKSIDGGENWVLLNPGPQFGWIDSLAIDPKNPAIIYAGVRDKNGVLKSSDGGANWTRIGPSDVNFRIVRLNPQNPTVIYAGSLMAGVYKSVDGGMNWKPANNGLNAIPISRLAFNPLNPAILFAGGIHGAYRSADNGRNWKKIMGLSTISELIMDPKNPDTIYTFGVRSDHPYDLGLFKSNDGGSIWNPTGFEHPEKNKTSEWTGIILAINPKDSMVLYVGTTQGIYKSSDGGASFAPMNSGFENLRIRALSINPQRPSTLFAITGKGLYKSIDGGAKWKIMYESPSLSCFAYDPRNPSTMFAVTYYGNVYKSTDGGAKWKMIDSESKNDITLANVRGTDEVITLDVDPQSPTTLYALCYPRGVYMSLDGGKKWLPFAEKDLADARIQSLTVDLSGKVYITTLNRGVLVYSSHPNH